MPTAEALLEPRLWSDLLAECEQRYAQRRARLNAYRALVESGAALRLARAYATGAYEPGLPSRHRLNRAGGRRKVVYRFEPEDDLLFKALNRVLMPGLEADLSPDCHSFRPGRGARSAFGRLLADPDLGRKHCLRLDVRDYFNQIDPTDLLASLPALMRHDAPLLRLLERTLLRPLVLSQGREEIVARKGVMAGTPLAPLLSNLYLRGLDRELRGAGLTYARYSDDLIVFGSAAEVAAAEARVREHLDSRGLEVNPEKTRWVQPGRPWEFLGLAWQAGRLDLSRHSAAKLRAKVRRLARRCDRRRRRHGRTGLQAAQAMLRRLNRKLYGAGGQRSEFNWATWFFPLLSGDGTLRALDGHLQEQVRFAATGRHERRNHRALPYADLRRLGYLPLVAAFHAFRQGGGAYAALLAKRVLT